MKIRTDEIPQSGRLIHFHWKVEKVSRLLRAETYRLDVLRPLNVDLELQKRQDCVEVSGSLTGKLSLRCDRCLERVPWSFRRQVHTFLLEKRYVPREEEVELDQEDLDREFYDGEIIDIDRLVTEEIFLELPYRFLCSDECRGLCPVCGANRNRQSCSCSQDRPGSPFEVLKHLMEERTGG